MKNATIACIIAAVALTFGPDADAKDKHHKKGHGAVAAAKVKGPAHIIAGCPPGLAKKNPPCVPPGQAKKYDHSHTYTRDHDHDRYHDRDRYRDHDHDHTVVYYPGDVIARDYIVVRDPRAYNLDPSLVYWRVGDMIYSVDQETREVLALIGAVDAILN